MLLRLFDALDLRLTKATLSSLEADPLRNIKEEEDWEPWGPVDSPLDYSEVQVALPSSHPQGLPSCPRADPESDAEQGREPSGESVGGLPLSSRAQGREPPEESVGGLPLSACAQGREPPEESVGGLPLSSRAQGREPQRSRWGGSPSLPAHRVESPQRSRWGGSPSLPAYRASVIKGSIAATTAPPISESFPTNHRIIMITTRKTISNTGSQWPKIRLVTWETIPLVKDPSPPTDRPTAPMEL